jgi:hypothetical protein
VNVRARLVAPLAVAVAAAAGSCTTIGTNPSVVTALEFDSLPYPAVVTGDTLRDSLGVAAPLRAVAFNSAGAVIPNPSLTYIAIDSGITISPAGIVTAQLRNGSVRVLASAPGLQTKPQALLVARRPDTVVASGSLADTLFYVLPDNSSNVLTGLGLKVATLDTAGGVGGTQGWLVSYQLIFRGKPLAVTDTTIASLWNSASQPSLVDTTGSDGSVSPSLRVRSTFLPTATESLTVVATVRYHGRPVPGSPLTYLVQIRLRSH